MSLSRETMFELMQYADGELDRGGRARVEALLETNEEARGVVEAIGMLGGAVRAGVEGRERGTRGADGIADRVLAAIEKEASAQQVAPTRGRRDRRPRSAIPVAIGVLALAAGVLFFLPMKKPLPIVRGSAQEATGPSAAPPLAASSSFAASEPVGIDLEEVRSIQNKVQVFFVPPQKSSGAAASVVVWIDDRRGNP